MNKPLKENHYFLESCTDVKDIAAPLQHLKTVMFTYMKNMHDGSQIYLSTQPQWINDYYSLQLYNSSYFEGDSKQYATGFKWWPGANDLPIYTHARDNFNSHQGITYCKQAADGCEFFFYSSSNKNEDLHDTYLNNLDLLESFSDYFTKQAEHIIKESNQHRIIRVRHEKIITPAPAISMRQQFLNAMGMNTPTVILNSLGVLNIQLSPRETEILNLVISGKSTKSIAKIMGLSPRTVESYFVNIKNKAGVSSKAELIGLFIGSISIR